MQATAILTRKYSPVEKGAPKPKMGDRCTAVSCFSGDINRRLQGAVSYPNQRFYDPRFPIYVPHPPTTEPIPPNRKLVPNPLQPGALPSDETAYKALEDAIQAAKEQAAKDCKDPKNCCKTITVRIECPGDPGSIDFNELITRLKKPILCGKSWTINCTTGNWKPS